MIEHMHEALCSIPTREGVGLNSGPERGRVCEYLKKTKPKLFFKTNEFA
jgi:hypothetical protein